MRQLLVLLLAIISIHLDLSGQEKDFSGFELSFDQDYFADFIRDGDEHFDKNYAVSMRLGFYGAQADHIYLGLPYVRRMVDGFLIDRFLFRKGFSEEKVSHNFTLTINGFSPTHISNEVEGFNQALAEGYDLSLDRPFSSFTGFRSTRRVEGFKRFVHSAIKRDLAVSTSFVFGFQSFGIVKGVENMLGARRPDANLWSRNDTLAYPTGQMVSNPTPMIMYGIIAETDIWRPLDKIVLQVRPELNLGTYTSLGLGLDLGKVMNVERLVDNLSFTDIHNPSLIVVNNDNLGLAISLGVTGRVVFYNQHLTGFLAKRDGDYESTSSRNWLLLDSYAGIKLQLFKKIELSFSINRRTPEFNTPVSQSTIWGTFGMKFLMEPEGEGCYN